MKNISLINRVELIRQSLKRIKADCLVVTKTANVTYTTGFLGNDSWSVITPRTVFLITDSRYSEQAEKECSNCKIIQRKGSLPEAVAKIVNRLSSVRIAVVENSTSITGFNLLKKKLKVKLKSADNVIEKVRAKKDSEEIKSIQRAAGKAQKALAETLPFIIPGITENELAGLLEFHIRKADAKNSFDTIAAFGSNAAHPHHQPGSRKLKKNDTVLLDFGAKYAGYCCDITRCFTVGKVSRYYEKVYDAVKQAQAAAIAIIKDGVEIKKADAAAREKIAEYNLPVFGHGTGHGLGLEVHESPGISPMNNDKFQAGMVITIEPAVYIPGKFGIRIEDDVLVTETGCKVLTRINK